MMLRWMFSLIIATHLVIAVHGSAPPPCGGNACYAVLVGPILNGIAKDFCSFYLHYPKTTTLTVKTTSTVTTTNTLPASIVKATATTKTTVSSTITSTATVPRQVVTSTVTKTVTVNQNKKRGWTPPPGSDKPSQLAIYAAPVISAACSCIVTPTAKTVTSTIKITAATQTVQKPPVTTTVATVTSTVIVTVTKPATVTAAPSTTTVTTTTTTTLAPPAQTCNGDPGTPQRAVRGTVQNTGFQVQQLYIFTAEACYEGCRNFTEPGVPPELTVPLVRSYVFISELYPGTTSSPGICLCYRPQVCAYFTIDPNGPNYAGDVQLPF